MPQHGITIDTSPGGAVIAMLLVVTIAASVLGCSRLPGERSKITYRLLW
jgi:hypothetical protein